MPNQAVTHIYDSQIASVYDWDKPQVEMKLFRRYGQQGLSMFQLFRMLSRATPVANDTWTAYEDNYIHENITVLNNVGDPGAGNTSTITLSPGDLDAYNNFYAKLNHIITIPLTEVQCMVTSISTAVPGAPTLTLMPIDSSDNIGALTAGTVLSITSNAHGEGTDQPDPSTRGAVKRTFQAQIFKETVALTGTQLATESWLQQYDSGEKFIGYYNLNMMDCEYRIALAEDGAYLTGKKNNNAALVVPAGVEGAGNLIKTTNGMLPWMRSLGNVSPYTPGTFAITDMDEMDIYLTSQGVTSPYVLFLMGKRLGHEVENKLVDFLKNTGVDYTRLDSDLFGDKKGMAVDIGFTGFTKAGRTYLMKSMDNWSNPKTFGAAGYDLDQFGMLLPLNKVKDPTTGEKLDNVGSRYRALGAYNRKYEVFQLGGAGSIPVKTTGVDKVTYNIRSHHGLQFMRVNQTILMDPA